MLLLKYIIAMDEHIELRSMTSMSNYSAVGRDSTIMNTML